MKILSFQPCSLYQNGGMGRLLRRLYSNNEGNITGVYCDCENVVQTKGQIKEIAISVFPGKKPWMRWKLRTFFTWMRESLFFHLNEYKIKKAVSDMDFDVLHIVNHGIFSAVLCNESFLTGKKIWTSFHDHYSLCSTYADTLLLWNRSDRRLVISPELGKEYQMIFGAKEFELITDGVTENEISEPKQFDTEITIYFGGLLHVDYYPLFEVLADALDILTSKGNIFKLIIRGTESLHFLNNRKFKVEYRSNFVLDSEIKKEIDSADILYLPIKFSSPNFYLYSLSTKMIGYLAGSGRVLYHGPSDSAAANLLNKHNSAVSCCSLNTLDMESCINELLELNCQVSINAKKVVYEYFMLSKIQTQFWNESTL